MLSRTRIKICGMTNKHDVLDTISVGVDAIGFIFVEESPRYVDPEVVRDIVTSIPPFIETVGVFKDKEVEVVKEIIQYCGLTMVQLHGEEPPEYCKSINARVIKAFRVGAHTERDELEKYAGIVKGYLLDTYAPGRAGGTGKTFDWSLVEKISPPGPTILAGGINPENVAEAIKSVRPFAVDANSGVEMEPGRKDIAKIKELIRVIQVTDAAMAQTL